MNHFTPAKNLDIYLAENILDKPELYSFVVLMYTKYSIPHSDFMLKILTNINTKFQQDNVLSKRKILWTRIDPKPKAGNPEKPLNKLPMIAIGGRYGHKWFALPNNGELFEYKVESEIMAAAKFFTSEFVS